jgi:hypothetical protein
VAKAVKDCVGEFAADPFIKFGVAGKIRNRQFQLAVQLVLSIFSVNISRQYAELK